MQNKVFIFDFDGTFYSGKDVFNDLPDFINLQKRNILCNLTDKQYQILIKENPFWKDIHVGSEIVDAIYFFMEKYPDWKISIKNFLDWQNRTLEPINIDKSQIVDITFMQELCKHNPVYLVSNSSLYHIKHYLSYIGIDCNMFKKIISNRFTKKDRTKKHYYEKIAKDENCSAKNIYVFGDSVKKDLLPAEKLGMNTFFINDATKIKDIVLDVLKN